jgi:hypothetical protein
VRASPSEREPGLGAREGDGHNGRRQAAARVASRVGGTHCGGAGATVAVGYPLGVLLVPGIAPAGSNCFFPSLPVLVGPSLTKMCGSLNRTCGGGGAFGL